MLPVAKADLEEFAGELILDGFWAMYQQLKGDQARLAKLLEDFYGDGEGERWTEEMSVRRVLGFQNGSPGRDIWRYKIWPLENQGFKFRVLYGYFPAARLFVVLGITERDKAYDFQSELALRISADYDRLFDKYG